VADDSEWKARALEAEARIAEAIELLEQRNMPGRWYDQLMRAAVSVLRGTPS
jgi:hypothetical protein